MGSVPHSRQDGRVFAVVITGAPGSGKTATLTALHDALADAGVANAAIDVDDVAWAFPYPDQAARLEALSDAVASHRRRGATLFLVAEVVETQPGLVALLDAIGTREHLLVRARGRTRHAPRADRRARAGGLVRASRSCSTSAPRTRTASRAASCSTPNGPLPASWGSGSAPRCLSRRRVALAHDGAPARSGRARLEQLDDEPEHADQEEDEPDRLNRDPGQGRLHSEPEDEPEGHEHDGGPASAMSLLPPMNRRCLPADTFIADPAPLMRRSTDDRPAGGHAGEAAGLTPARRPGVRGAGLVHAVQVRRARRSPAGAARRGRSRARGWSA